MDTQNKGQEKTILNLAINGKNTNGIMNISLVLKLENLATFLLRMKFSLLLKSHGRMNRFLMISK